jgi:hypothetical protein
MPTTVPTTTATVSLTTATVPPTTTTVPPTTTTALDLSYTLTQKCNGVDLLPYPSGKYFQSFNYYFFTIYK